MEPSTPKRSPSTRSVLVLVGLLFVVIAVIGVALDRQESRDRERRSEDFCELVTEEDC